MKNLKTILEESILGDIETRINTNKDIIDIIKDFLDKSYFGGSRHFKIVKKPNSESKYIVTCKGETQLRPGASSITNGLFIFADTPDDFCIGYNKNIKSLDGCPNIVKGDFDCRSTAITSLEHAPEETYGNFICTYCNTEFTEDDVKKVCNVHKKIFV